MIIGQNGDSKIHEGKIVRESFLGKLKENLVIIPAAGYGTRVGSPPAKELLPHPLYPMTFMEKALTRVEESSASPLVISREDKHQLNIWLLEKEIPHVLVTQTKEWVQTVKVTAPYWQKKNLLLLPDTEFDPPNILNELLSGLDAYDLSLAVFDVLNLQTWGAVKDGFIAEKISSPEAGKAWGLLAFKKNIGKEFWNIYEEAQISHNWTPHTFKTLILKLNHFEDLTRPIAL